MADARNPAFTDQEVAAQARVNAAALPYVLVAYAKEHGRSAEEAGAFAGRHFAPGWGELKGQGAAAVARLVALNLASVGGTIRGLSGDDDAAEVRVAGLPSEQDAAFFGLSRDEADGFFAVFGPIAVYLGFRGEWRREGEEVVLTLRRAAD